MFLLLSICAAITISDCNLKYSNYFKVRETTCTTLWHSAVDNLDGTQADYGTLGTDCNWSIKFDQFTDDDEILVTLYDKEMW